MTRGFHACVLCCAGLWSVWLGVHALVDRPLGQSAQLSGGLWAGGPDPDCTWPRSSPRLFLCRSGRVMGLPPYVVGAPAAPLWGGPSLSLL